MNRPEEEDSPSLAGHFLIAMPGLADPNFAFSVTYICVHNREGAFGFVVNRVAPGGSLGDVFRELEMETVSGAGDQPIHIGGPVHPGHVFVLHGPPFGWDASVPVSETVAMSNSRDILAAIAGGRGPRDFLLVLGCAGWAPGQLEEEIVENSWLTARATDEILFSVPVDERWEAAARLLGIDPRLLAETPGHA